MFPKRRDPPAQSDGGPTIPKGVGAPALKRRRLRRCPSGTAPAPKRCHPRRLQSSRGPCPNAAEAPAFPKKLTMAPVQQSPCWSKSGEGRCPKAAEPPVFPKRRSPAQSGGGPRVPKNVEALAHKRQKPWCSQSGGTPGIPKEVEATTPKRQRPWQSQSRGGSCPKPRKPRKSENGVAPAPKWQSPPPKAVEVPRPKAAEAPAPKRRRRLPKSGGGRNIPKPMVAPTQKQQMPRCPISCGGLCPKAAHALMFPKRRTPLAANGRGPDSPKAAEDRSPKRRRPSIPNWRKPVPENGGWPQSGGAPCPKVEEAKVLLEQRRGLLRFGARVPTPLGTLCPPNLWCGGLCCFGNTGASAPFGQGPPPDWEHRGLHGLGARASVA